MDGVVSNVGQKSHLLQFLDQLCKSSRDLSSGFTQVHQFNAGPPVQRMSTKFRCNLDDCVVSVGVEFQHHKALRLKLQPILHATWASTIISKALHNCLALILGQGNGQSIEARGRRRNSHAYIGGFFANQLVKETNTLLPNKTTITISKTKQKREVLRQLVIMN
jgi:hypothetical protein